MVGEIVFIWLISKVICWGQDGWLMARCVKVINNWKDHSSFLHFSASEHLAAASDYRQPRLHDRGAGGEEHKGDESGRGHRDGGAEVHQRRHQRLQRLQRVVGELGGGVQVSIIIIAIYHYHHHHHWLLQEHLHWGLQGRQGQGGQAQHRVHQRVS